MADLSMAGAVKRYSYLLSDRIPFSGEYYPRKTAPTVVYDMHYPLELIIMLKGRWRRYYPGWAMEMTAGEVSFCGMWESHGIKTSRNESCDIFVLIIWPALVARLFCPEAPDFNWMAPFIAPPQKRPRVPAHQRRYFIDLGYRFVAAMKEPPALRLVWFRILLMECLLTLSKTWRMPAVLKAANPPFQQLNPAIELVFGSQRFIPSAQAATACGMSRLQFTRFFRANMGISFADFSLRHKLDQALGQMLSSTAPLKSIARECGFADESHFHRVFTRQYRCSPIAYRTKHANPPK